MRSKEAYETRYFCFKIKIVAKLDDTHCAIHAAQNQFQLF